MELHALKPQVYTRYTYNTITSAKKMQYISTRKINSLMLFWEVTAVCFENNCETITTTC
jgi:hypothetical protein